jgi:hypothetical protein
MTKRLRSIPIEVNGRLNKVEIIVFSVPEAELTNRIPNEIVPLLINGRALFSIVRARLDRMSAKGPPTPPIYHHVAVRMCVKDKEYNRHQQNKGLYFYRSFSNKPFMSFGGNRFTKDDFEMAEINAAGSVFEMNSKDTYIKFALDKQPPEHVSPEIYDQIQQLDRAYYVESKKLYVTKITREAWPMRWADCYAFETNLFKDVKLEAAFYIHDTIQYRFG